MAVHREIHGNRLLRRVFDFPAGAVPTELAVAHGGQAPAALSARPAGSWPA